MEAINLVSLLAQGGAGLRRRDGHRHHDPLRAVLPDGSQNYDKYNNPKITAALEQARGTANPDQRAALVARAEKLAAADLPWIPNAQPTSLLLLGKGLTGAVSSFAYMFAPWANQLGGTG